MDHYGRHRKWIREYLKSNVASHYVKQIRQSIHQSQHIIRCHEIILSELSKLFEERYKLVNSSFPVLPREKIAQIFESDIDVRPLLEPSDTNENVNKYALFKI